MSGPGTFRCRVCGEQASALARHVAGDVAELTFLHVGAPSCMLVVDAADVDALTLEALRELVRDRKARRAGDLELLPPLPQVAAPARILEPARAKPAVTGRSYLRARAR